MSSDNPPFDKPFISSRCPYPSMIVLISYLHAVISSFLKTTHVLVRNIIWLSHKLMSENVTL